MITAFKKALGKGLTSILILKLSIIDQSSTGSKLQAMRQVIKKAGGEVVLESAIFTEGDACDLENVIALGHLPLFTD